VRECANECLRLAKGRQVPIFLVGHVTKDGNIAGPRVLEHLVDTVLYFEGGREADTANSAGCEEPVRLDE
jgi:DNA repair protein RadA/Sms